jgi:maleate isomerase
VTGKTSEGLRQAFDRILAELLDTIGAARTTLRLDDATYGFHIDDVVAEALAPGENSLRGQTSINQRAAATASWVEKNRRLLVQSDLSSGEPRAPPALIKLYGVRAQMLAPVEREGRLDGWISVHEVRGTRNWTEQEQAALRKAAEQVRRELG